MLEAWLLRSEDVKTRDEALRTNIRELNDADRSVFYRDYQKKIKDPDTYAVLNWLFLTGLHHLYLGKFLRGIANIAILIFGVIMLFYQGPFGLLIIGAVLLFETPALFRSQLIVADHNIRVGERILHGLQRTDTTSSQ